MKPLYFHDLFTLSVTLKWRNKAVFCLFVYCKNQYFILKETLFPPSENRHFCSVLEPHLCLYSSYINEVATTVLLYMGWFLMSITTGYIKGNLPRSKSEFNFLLSTVVFCQQKKKLFEKNLMKDATGKAVTIILDKMQNFTINSEF